MTYKAVLFDMDGVILDSEPLHVAAFQATLKEYGHDLSDKDYKDFFAGRTDKEGFERYFTFINESVELPVVMDEKTRAYIALAADQLQAYPGVVSIIKELSRQMKLALVTGSLRVEAEIALKACGIEDCFDAMIAAEDVEHGKPNPEGYLKAIHLFDVSTEESVIVEDSPSGVKAARAAGIDCIAVTNTHTRNELSDATSVVDSLTLSSFIIE